MKPLYKFFSVLIIIIVTSFIIFSILMPNQLLFNKVEKVIIYDSFSDLDNPKEIEIPIEDCDLLFSYINNLDFQPPKPLPEPYLATKYDIDMILTNGKVIEFDQDLYYILYKRGIIKIRLSYDMSEYIAVVKKTIHS